MMRKVENQDDFDESSNQQNLPLKVLQQNEKDNFEIATYNELESELVHLSTSSRLNPRFCIDESRYHNCGIMVLQNRIIDASNLFSQKRMKEVLISERPQFIGLSRNIANKIQMFQRNGYEPQYLSSNQESTEHWQNLVYISYQLEWEGLFIQDQFLWPKSSRSVYDMKIFAVDFLSDLLKNDFHKYQSHQIEWPQLSFVKGSEHLIEIKLDIKWENKAYKDQFLWDISDPDNSPEEFAHQVVNELHLPNVFRSLISLQIRNEICSYALKCLEVFANGIEQAKDFEMPITFVTIQQPLSDESDSDQQIPSPIIPQKRQRKDSSQNDIETNLEPVQKRQNMNGKQIEQKNKKGVSSEYSSKKMTPKKIKTESLQSSSSSAHPNNNKIQIIPKINGNVNENLKLDKKRSIKEQSKSLTPQFTITLKKDKNNKYSLCDIKSMDTNKIKITLDNKTTNLYDQSHNLIKIPNGIKDPKIGYQVHHSSTNSSKIKLDMSIRTPQKQDTGNEIQYNTNNHLIQIDLKSIYSNGHTNSPIKEAPVLQNGSAHDYIDFPEEVETNGNGSLSTKPKQISKSEQEEFDHSDNVHSQNAIQDDQLFRDFE